MRARGLRLRALRAALALLLACGERGVALTCENENQVQIPYTTYSGRERYDTYKCVECGVGKYGSGGKCHDCPSFMRQRPFKDVHGSLWCTNSCGEMWKTLGVVNDVEFEATGRTEAEKTALYLTPKPVCKKCTGQTFFQQVAGIGGFGFMQRDLEAMGIPKADLTSVHYDAPRRFSINLCRSCPPGFVFGKWFVHGDVKTMSGNSAMTVPVDDLLVIPCQTCAVAEGVPQLVDKIWKCTGCPRGQFQLARWETFITHVKMIPGQRFVDELTSLVVGVECQECPAGMEAALSSGKGYWQKFQCRGSLEECCSNCPFNHFKETKAGECTRVIAAHVALKGKNFVEEGGTAQRSCVKGERLFYCADGECGTSSGWRTCLPCSLDATTYATDTGCKQCLPAQKQHLVDPTNPGKCAECSSCTELVTVASDVKLKDVPLFAHITNTYTVQQVSASCNPLRTRSLTKTTTGVLQVDGEAHWRAPAQATGERLPDHHFLKRTNDTCAKTPCSGRCQARFQYSNGCGNSVSSDSTWVAKNEQTQLVSALVPAQVAEPGTWRVLTEGKCMPCQPCSAGSHNDGCDKQQQYEAGTPQGTCKPCLSACPAGNFLWHSEKEAGCHEPPAHHNATDGSDKFEVSADYECKRCPTWVLDGQNLSVVAACGLHAAGDTYEHYNSVSGGELQKTSKPVQPMPRGEELIAGFPRKNFRGFVANLLDYCPSAFFFDPTVPGCDFVNNGGQLSLPGRNSVRVGYDAYKPACCQACKSCAGATEKKDMNSWKQCTGNSLVDTQDRCVAKCVLGYWEADKECRRCSSCYDGVLV